MVPWSDEIVQVRGAVIRDLLETGRLPSPRQLADDLAMSETAVRTVLSKMHEAGAVLLDKHGNIRMLVPFSAVPTPFAVSAGGRAFWANCAFDSLGIAAALGSDAVIRAALADAPGEAIITVAGGRVTPADYLVHFPLPFRRWYDNLVYT